jgi:hypothetical protein
MKKKILRTFKLREISCVDFPAQEGARMTIMKSTFGARADAIAQLHDRKIQEYMQSKGCSHQEAIAALGAAPIDSMAKAAPTAADTCEATILYFAEEHAKRRGMPLTKAQAEFLETPFGKELYASYDLEKQTPAENVTKAQFDAALVILAKAFQEGGLSKWAAMNKALGTPLGRELYRKASEAA